MRTPNTAGFDPTETLAVHCANGLQPLSKYLFQRIHASTTRGFVDAGGLMSYGADGPAIFRHSARFVQRILQGRQPNDLPIEQPTKFELAVNLRTAKAMGLTIPESFLARDDEVID